MIKTGNREQDYLLVLLRCALKQEKAPAPDNVDMKALLKLAVSQQVYNTVLPCLDEIDALPEEDKEKWNNYRLTELQRTIVVNNERNHILSQFDEQNIKYIFLKGLVLRELYPQTAMRQMSDNDIMFDASRREDVKKIMLANGYYLSSQTDKSDDYYKEPYTMLELHRELFNHEYMKETYTADLIWQNAEKADGMNCRYIMSNEDNYAFTLLHMFKHYIMEGCGVRFLCDMYLLNQHSQNLDFVYIDSLLQKIQDNPKAALIEDLPDLPIPKFKNMVNDLVNAVFCGSEITAEAQALLNDMLSGGVYGSGKTLQDKIDEQGGRFRYVLSRTFPAKENIFENYPLSKKYKWLLPFFYIKRIFDKLKYRKSFVKREIKALKK